MSHFYGKLQGGRKEVTRTGSKKSGMTSKVASWDGAIEVRVSYNPKTRKNHFMVWQRTHEGSGISQLMVEGIIGEKNE